MTYTSQLVGRFGNKMFQYASLRAEAAREMAPHISGIGPIDELYGGWNLSEPCYCFEPRLAIQYENYSDLQRAVLNNGASMEDDTHVAKLR